MTAVLVNVVEINRTRLVALEGVALALGEAINAGERDYPARDAGASALDPVRELRRALAALVTQPLPEGLIVGTSELGVELEAPAHELEDLAERLERFSDRASRAGEGAVAGRATAEVEHLAADLEQLAATLRVRARER